MEQETRRTVNTHRRCAAYPPGLGVNSKAECRRRMGVRGRGERERERRSSQRKEDTRVNINAPSIQNMHCVHSVNVSLHVLLEEHFSFIHSVCISACIFALERVHSCTCVCVCVYLDSIIVTVSSIQTGQAAYLALGPRSRGFLWRGHMLCRKQHTTTCEVQKYFYSQFIPKKCGQMLTLVSQQLSVQLFYQHRL